ncbi:MULTISPECIES: hypothetical protein [unclassified Nostoc]|uniref:hypothetical protein n=1 Tax=unclassified Nostoc TaxID=2593658 RepID=UPI0025F8CF14|nr:hypothetical protein [Nostoc sp. JL23]
MTIYTSYYRGEIRGEAISISLYPPKNWKGKHLPLFAPTPELVEGISPGYRRTVRIHQGVREDSGFSSATNSIVGEKTEFGQTNINAPLPQGGIVGYRGRLLLRQG